MFVHFQILHHDSLVNNQEILNEGLSITLQFQIIDRGIISYIINQVDFKNINKIINFILLYYHHNKVILKYIFLVLKLNQV